jgi:predicted nucleic acid-binding protein
MADIIRSITERVVVTTYVQAEEVITVYEVSKQAAPLQKETINLDPFLERKLLITADLESEEEKMTFVRLVIDRLDDGEATTVAIAAHRHWAIATDDHRARRICREKFSGIHLISTPDLVRHWAQVAAPTADELSQALIDIEQRANYLVGTSHTLYQWWQSSKKLNET